MHQVVWSVFWKGIFKDYFQSQLELVEEAPAQDLEMEKVEWEEWGQNVLVSLREWVDQAQLSQLYLLQEVDQSLHLQLEVDQNQDLQQEVDQSLHLQLEVDPDQVCKYHIGSFLFDFLVWYDFALFLVLSFHF
jgi:hypothetical protein